MEKTKKYLTEQYEYNDNVYYDCVVKLQEKKEELILLQQQVESLQRDVERYDVLRKQYQDMLNELNDTE